MVDVELVDDEQERNRSGRGFRVTRLLGGV